MTEICNSCGQKILSLEDFSETEKVLFHRYEQFKEAQKRREEQLCLTTEKVSLINPAKQLVKGITAGNY